MIPHSFEVTNTHRETGDVLTFSAVPCEKSEAHPCDFSPGQFSMLYLHGLGDIPISISGDCSKKQELSYTVRSVGAISAGLTSLKPGDTLGVSGPFGRGWPLEEAKGKELVLIAGGLGLAPLRSLISLARDNPEFFKKVTLLYGGRSPEELIFKNELEEWKELFDFRLTVDFAEPGYVGHVGVVPGLIPSVELDPENCLVCVCGPEIMMRFTIHELRLKEIKDNKIFLSLERNMKCAIGHCGHCQLGPSFICKDGPVMCYEKVKELLGVREL